jgi:hypothetical protein
MDNIFLPVVSLAAIEKAKKDKDTLYDLLAQPLHEGLYKHGSFEFMGHLSPGQQALLAYDYVRMQVLQGGFIQFIQNGYIALLPDLIGQLYKFQCPDMALVLDDVLKVYVLNRELLDKPTTVEEFAKLYDELKEFEIIDDRFTALNEATIDTLLAYATAHLNEFVSPVK